MLNLSSSRLGTRSEGTESVEWDNIRKSPEKAARYEEFVDKLCHDPEYICLIQTLVNGKHEEQECSKLATSLINILRDLNYVFPILQIILGYSLESSFTSKFSEVFPTPSLAAKMFEFYALKNSHVLISVAFSEIIEQFTSGALVFEKIYEPIERCLTTIIMDDYFIEFIPRRIRVICYSISLKCQTLPKKFPPESWKLLIGKLMLAHVFLPGLKDLKASGLVPENADLKEETTSFVEILKAAIRHIVNDTNFLENEFPQLHILTQRLTSAIGPWVDKIITDPTIPKTARSQSTVDPTLTARAVQQQQQLQQGIISTNGNENYQNTPPWKEVYESHFPSSFSFLDLSPMDFANFHLSLLHFVQNASMSTTPRENGASQQRIRKKNLLAIPDLVSLLRECPIKTEYVYESDANVLESTLQGLTKSLNSFKRVSQLSSIPARSSAVNTILKSSEPLTSFDN